MVLKIDPGSTDDNHIPRARLLLVWEVCRTNNKVEVRDGAQKAVARAPPLLSLGGHETAKKAQEKAKGFEFSEVPDPSKG